MPPGLVLADEPTGSIRGPSQLTAGRARHRRGDARRIDLGLRSPIDDAVTGAGYTHLARQLLASEAVTQDLVETAVHRGWAALP